MANRFPPEVRERAGGPVPEILHKASANFAQAKRA
jgi:hypothetical protein